MSEAPVGYDAVLEEYCKTARIEDIPKYEGLYRRSMDFPDELWGERAGGIYAFIQPVSGAQKRDELKRELANLIRTKIGGPAEIDVIQWADTLPRTPSGKILRVLLQRIAAGEVHDLGDVAALADADVVETLVKGRLELGEV